MSKDKGSRWGKDDNKDKGRGVRNQDKLRQADKDRGKKMGDIYRSQRRREN